jgi:ankyrin repeat protein
MRLLQIQANGSFSLVNHDSTSIPPYAILSHTWSENNEDEVSFADMRNETGKDKRGYAKLKFCAEQATKDGLEYFWVDTCCIDKSSSAELSEAITSMFRWYKNSAQCYVYLADVTTREEKVDHETPDHEAPDVTWVSDFQTSRWFTRGWTLQELLAPRVVLFFSRDGRLLGDKSSLERYIHDVTRIPVSAFRGASLHSFSVEERMSWVRNRTTKREEDSAYSLLGLFGVSMVPIYGEEKAAAFRRLRKEIREAAQDQDGALDDEERQAIIKAKQKKALMESLRFDQIDARYATIKNAHAKTCKWLLQKSEHIEWLESTRLPIHHGFLWIKGKPGTGKSTLMKFALGQARESTDRNIVIAFFFNARGETLEKTVVGMYRSLLLQLLEKVPTLSCPFDSLSLLPSTVSRDYQWTRNSLEDQLQQAVLSLEETPVICFIDALDECEQWQVRSMMSFFEHLGELAVSSGRSFRVCLSSRHYPEVTIRRGISLVLEGQEGHTKAIDDYLESALRIGTSEHAQQIRKDLQQKSSGVFMWIVLVVSILNKEYDGGRMYALKRRLEEIPADLHELFRDILTRDPDDKDELILCIRWVLFAKEPLTPEQLYLAILAGIEPDALHQTATEDTIRRFLLRSSKGLTEITMSGEEKVQFIHESVRDFLLKENSLSKVWPEFGSNFVGQSHERLKQCCYDYININITRTLDLPDDLPRASTPQSADPKRFAYMEYPLLEYAVRNVLYHADLAEGRGISQADFLDSFPLLHWVEFDNLFQQDHLRRHTRGVSLLYILAELNTPNLIKVLGSANCCIDVEAEVCGCPLFAAFAMSNGQAVEMLLESIEAQSAHSSPVSAIDKRKLQDESVWSTTMDYFVYSESMDFLENAAVFRHDGFLARLIASGRFALDSQDSHHRSLLWWASGHGWENSVRVLLAADPAMVNVMDKYSVTPLMIAALYGHLEVIKMLLAEGAYVNIISRNGTTALWEAMTEKDEAIVKLLLDKGADIEAECGNYSNVLQAASAKGCDSIVEHLLKLGTNVNAYGGHFGTALQAASAEGYYSIVKCLLDWGANVNANGGYFGTALQAASCRGHTEMVKLLLRKGADPHMQGGHHGNAFNAGLVNGNKEILALIKKYKGHHEHLLRLQSPA